MPLTHIPDLTDADRAEAVALIESYHQPGRSPALGLRVLLDMYTRDLPRQRRALAQAIERRTRALAALASAAPERLTDAEREELAARQPGPRPYHWPRAWDDALAEALDAGISRGRIGEVVGFTHTAVSDRAALLGRSGSRSNRAPRRRGEGPREAERQQVRDIWAAHGVPLPDARPAPRAPAREQPARDLRQQNAAAYDAWVRSRAGRDDEAPNA